MATLGNTTAPSFGWEYQGINSLNQVASILYTVPTNCYINSISFYAAGWNGSVSATGVVWKSDNSVLCKGTPISIASGLQSAGGQAWHSVGVNQYVASGTQIRIGFWRSNSGQAVWSETSGTTGVYNTSTNPGALTGASNLSFGNIGAYITYTPSNPPQAPTVTTNPATSITFTSATLNGVVNPQALATTYYFQWGLTTGYGNNTATTGAGNGGGSVNVSAGIAGLVANTTYHARLVATNSIGTTNGNDITFTTPAQYVAPKAPTLVAPANGTTLDVSHGVTFSAIYNSQDTFTQSAYQLAITTGGTTKYWNGSALQTGSVFITDTSKTRSGQVFSVFLGSSILSNGNTYTWTFSSQESGNSLQGPPATVNAFTSKSQPAWNAPYNPQTSAQDNLNQLHFAHTQQKLYDGARVDDLNTAHGAFFPMFGNSGPTSVAGAFVLTGTKVGRVEIPISLLTSETTACDVQVSLVNNTSTGSASVARGSGYGASMYGGAIYGGSSGGTSLPGSTVLASTVIPSDVLVRLASLSGPSTSVGSLMPRFQQSVIESFTTSAQPYPNSGYINFAYANAPSNLITVGGASGGVPTTATYIGQFNTSTGDFNLWNAGPALPVALYTAGGTYSNGYVYAIGGLNAGHHAVATVYSITINDGSSLMGSWQTQTAIPVANYAPTVTSDPNTGAVYVIGGFVSDLGAGVAGSNTIYWTIPSNGNISGWNTATLPEGVGEATAVCLNGFLIVICGNTNNTNNTTVTNAVWYAPINSDGSLGAFTQGPSYPLKLWNLYSTTFGNNIIVMGGQNSSGTQVNNVYTIGFTGSEWGKWTAMSNLPVTSSGGGAASFLDATGTQFDLAVVTGTSNTAVVTSGATVPYVSVPLYATGLTGGGTYWITLTPLEANPVNIPQVSVNDTMGDGFATNTGGAWTLVSSSEAINFRVYDATVAGRILNTWEDSGARWTWAIYNETTGQPQFYTECIARTTVPSVASMYELVYNADGSLGSLA